MTADNWLFAFIICVVALAIWLFATNDGARDQRDEEMWP